MRSIRNIALTSPFNVSTTFTKRTTYRKIHTSLYKSLPIQTSQRNNENVLELQKPELIIFDKDGTLICFHSMWIPWAINTAKSLEEATGLVTSRDVFQLLGICPVKKKVKPGLLAEATMQQIKVEIQKLLMQNGVKNVHKLDVIDRCIHESQSACPSKMRAIQDIRSLFITLKNNNIKIAMCTSDNRKNTMSTLQWLEVENIVDIIVCGDDPESKPKPHPHNAINICRILQVEPENAVMVGDTLADIHMARAAGLMAVGVLSGVGEVDYLEPHADILVSITSIFKILCLIRKY
ncbi:haloacid dehalogenase-like hydrolase [Dictyocaulus viviparus]|uniref:Haloacid dehalogenase-like hydrolase n=1 Tax=Dictyocaulus viviparus TaxID=29172 RepID=A0A0D8XUW0_DICVI|nr:haloacid dehalogenase-like hydrolase [Dictyocaulus viviparus]